METYYVIKLYSLKFGIYNKKLKIIALCSLCTNNNKLITNYFPEALVTFVGTLVPNYSLKNIYLYPLLKLGAGSAVDVNDDNAIKSILVVSPLLHLASWQWFDQDGISF